VAPQPEGQEAHGDQVIPKRIKLKKRDGRWIVEYGPYQVGVFPDYESAGIHRDKWAKWARETRAFYQEVCS
jgi:hypothetical protein